MDLRAERYRVRRPQLTNRRLGALVTGSISRLSVAIAVALSEGRNASNVCGWVYIYVRSGVLPEIQCILHSKGVSKGSHVTGSD